MKRRFLTLSGVTKSERHQVTTAISEAISVSGGWIVDHVMYSNITIAIRFSLPPQGLDELQRRVTAADVRLDDESLAKLRQMVDGASGGTAEIEAALNVTFFHNEPDLRREIPAVPG